MAHSKSCRRLEAQLRWKSSVNTSRQLTRLDIEHHRVFFDQLASKLHLNTADDWYWVTKQQILESGGRTLLKNCYENSAVKALETVYPHVKWQPWRFTHISDDWWEDRHHRREFLKWVGDELHVKEMQDWYAITKADIIKLGGKILLLHHHNSHVEALQSLFPECAWQRWRFASPDERFHDTTLDIAQQLDISAPEGWYAVKKVDIVNIGGQFVFDEFEGSLANALEALYPDYTWQPWRFALLPDGFWDDVKNQRRFFDWLGEQLGIKRMRDWFTVSPESVHAHGGGFLLTHVHKSLRNALKAAYPTHDWPLWKFQQVPVEYWDDRDHHREFFDWLGKELDFKSFEDYYRLTNNHIRQHGGTVLITQFYHKSTRKALAQVYPKVDWQPWKFRKQPKDYWQNKDHHRAFLQWLEEQLQIHNPEDWHGVTTQLVRVQHGTGILRRYGNSLTNLLSDHYPNQKWNGKCWKDMVNVKTQQFACRLIQQLIPNVAIEREAFVPQIKYRDTNRKMQLDIWLPTLNLALEYQGMQHYMDNRLVHGRDGLEDQYHADREKSEACDLAGIQLVHLPYWWNSSISSLGATLNQYYPVGYGDCEPVPTSLPLSLSPPLSNYGLWRLNDDEPIFEPIKPHKWNASIDPAGWTARVYTNRMKLFTDGRGSIYLPDGGSFDLPARLVDSVSHGIPLELELITFDDEPFGLCVVDAPTCLGDLNDRIEFAKHVVGRHPNITFLTNWCVHSIEEIFAWRVNRILRQDLVISRLHTPYLRGKAPSLLVVRVKHIEDGLVVGHQFARDRNCHVMVKIKDKIIKVRSRLRKKKQVERFPVGSVVQISYFECDEEGVPKDAGISPIEYQLRIPFLTLKKIDRIWTQFMQTLSLQVMCSLMWCNKQAFRKVATHVQEATYSINVAMGNPTYPTSCCNAQLMVVKAFFSLN